MPLTAERLHLIKDDLDELYERLNQRRYIHPDPLEFLYEWEDWQEREIVGLIASSLAYGRVVQILKSVSIVLRPMRPSPVEFIRKATVDSLDAAFSTFRHRFTSGHELICLLLGIQKLLDTCGSLCDCFKSHLQCDDNTLIPALSAFVEDLTCGSPLSRNSLLPSPLSGSACKRLNLFLRWMIRHDDVDPGCWQGISPERLIIPLDTHMLRIGTALSFTHNRCGNMLTARQITDAFRVISPGDPVRYDFCLTRLGIVNRGDPLVRKLAEKLSE